MGRAVEADLAGDLFGQGWLSLAKTMPTLVKCRRLVLRDPRLGGTREGGQCSYVGALAALETPCNWDARGGPGSVSSFLRSWQSQKWWLPLAPAPWRDCGWRTKRSVRPGHDAHDLGLLVYGQQRRRTTKLLKV